MRRTRAQDTKAILILLIAAVLLAFLCDILITCVEKVIYPKNYYDEVMEYSSKYAVPAELVFAVIKVESDFDKDAKSHAGALGLMQMIPSTYKWLAEDHLGEIAITEMLYEPSTNIKYGTYYLRYLHTRFGSWEKAIIAYNWGETNFASFIEEHGYTEGDYNSIPVRETRNYVKKVMQYWEKYENLYK